MSSLSIVIPTYERRNLVSAAVDSALVWLDRLGEGEIIVVDDASTDGTLAHLEERYAADVRHGRIKLHLLARNRGVTGAKNAGAAIAQNEWVVFLDSDDRLVSEAATLVRAELKTCRAPVVFFRCVDLLTGEIIGKNELQPAMVELKRYISEWEWGECLPVIRREVALAVPYDEDLRGYEGLAYARIIKAYGPAKISGVIARRYDKGDHARITNACRCSRWRRQRRFTAIMLTEFGTHFSLKMTARYVFSHIRACFDGLRCRSKEKG